MDSSIRRATAQDAAALAELGAETFAETFAGAYPEADLQAFLAANHTPAKLAAALADPAIAIWVVEQDGRLVGYAQVGPPDIPHPEVRPEHGELKRLYLRPEAQGAGLGARLTELALAWMEAEGRTPVWLSVWAHGHAAQQFYARYGFEKVGEYDWAVGDFADPSFIMRRATAR
jgi:ribosomal protein S18 acetylase RimI-like enzyme